MGRLDLRDIDARDGGAERTSMSSVISTIQLLIAWANWGEAHHIGYPIDSPGFGNRALRSPLIGMGNVPPDVWRIEEAICRVPFEDRDVIIQRYQRRRTFRKIGRRMGLSKWAAMNRLKRAEVAVHHELVRNPCVGAPRKGINGRQSKTDSPGFEPESRAL
jgi:hypothetical protein